jgi:hypothetical protein
VLWEDPDDGDWRNDGVAKLGNGIHYHVNTFNLDEIQSQLESVFEEIGSKRKGKLVK